MAWTSQLQCSQRQNARIATRSWSATHTLLLKLLPPLRRCRRGCGDKARRGKKTRRQKERFSECTDPDLPCVYAQICGDLHDSSLIPPRSLAALVCVGTLLLPNHVVQGSVLRTWLAWLRPGLASPPLPLPAFGALEEPFTHAKFTISDTRRKISRARTHTHTHTHRGDMRALSTNRPMAPPCLL